MNTFEMRGANRRRYIVTRLMQKGIPFHYKPTTGDGFILKVANCDKHIVTQLMIFFGQKEQSRVSNYALAR